jgi:hypothetical protein
LREGSEFTIDRWDVWRPPDDGPGRAAVGCFGVDLGTWTDEATPLALERLSASMGAVALRLDGTSELHLAATEHAGAVVEQAFVRVAAPPGPTVARTFLGFAGPGDSPHLRGCFALCAPTTGACEGSLSSASATDFVAPPPASFPVRALVFGVHHPRGVAMGSVGLFVLLGVVAVWTRPRSRRK